MTWSLSNTIATASAADNHTALVYLFDTYLNGRSQFTVSAHPDASAFKRRVTCTVNDGMYGGTYSFYNWVNWTNTSPTGLTWYEDATYTTTPGDLATDTTSSLTTNNDLWGTTFGNWRFWTSDQDANACLVTIGKRIIFYWPGGSNYNVYSQATPAWDGTTDRTQTHIFPYVGIANGSMYYCNRPITSGDSTLEYMMTLTPAMNSTDVGYLGGKEIFWKSPTWMYTVNSTVSSTGWSNKNLPVVQVGNDQAVWMSPSYGNTPYHLNISGQGQKLLLNSTDWWFCPNSAVYAPLCFYMGTSEPDMS